MKRDEFDAVLELENSLLVRGKEEGVEAGKRLGFQDGHTAGFTKGSEIGKEIGFYYGHAIVWNKLIEKHPKLFSDRSKKTVSKLADQIAGYSLDANNEKVIDQLEDIRSTYKLACSQMRSLYKAEETLSF